MALKASDLTIAVSHFVQVRIAVSARKAILIPNPISSSFLAQLDAVDEDQLRPMLGLPVDAVIVGSIGRVTRQKGVHTLALAFVHLVEDCQSLNAPLHLLIGGIRPDDRANSSYVESLRSILGKEGIKEHVTFVGYSDNIAPYMKTIDIFVLASVDDGQQPVEGFGLVAVEAMAAGCAVVGTNVGGIPEIVQDGITGLLYEAGDWHSLATSLRKLVNDVGLRDRLANEGRRYVSDRHSETVFRQALIAAIENSEGLLPKHQTSRLSG